MAYLNQGQAGNSYCEVVAVGDSNYAIFLGSDPSMVTCEKTASAPGVYSTTNLDQPITDENIVNVVSSWYSKPVMGNVATVREWIAALLWANESKPIKPMMGLPKMTKVLAAGLSSIKELMVIHEDYDAFRFLCFGYRRPIAEFLTKSNFTGIYLFPERFYVSCLFETRFKDNFGIINLGNTWDALYIANHARDKVSLLMTADWEQHTGFLERTFMER